MGSFSAWHWLIVLAVVLVLFGRGKIPELMGDVAKGIKSFKNGMKDDDKQSEETSAKGKSLHERPSPVLANPEGRPS